MFRPARRRAQPRQTTTARPALAHKSQVAHKPVHNSESYLHQRMPVPAHSRVPVPALNCIHSPARTTAAVVPLAPGPLRPLASELRHATLTTTRLPFLTL